MRHCDCRPAAGVTAYPRAPQEGAPAAMTWAIISFRLDSNSLRNEVSCREPARGGRLLRVGSAGTDGRTEAEDRRLPVDGVDIERKRLEMRRNLVRADLERVRVTAPVAKLQASFELLLYVLPED